MRAHAIALSMIIAVLSAACGGALAQSLSPSALPPPGATACSGCHGGRDSAMPSLQGKSAADIEAAMIAYRGGARDATVMDRIAKGFSDSETKAIASWIAQSGAAK